jgi:hypothetical protein
MTQITIGGAAYTVALPTYRYLKRAWRYLNQASGSDDLVTGMDAIIGVIAVGLQTPFPGEPPAPIADGKTEALEAWRIAYIDDHMAPSEMRALRPFLNDLLVEAGLSDPQTGAATESPSTATSTA